MFHRIIFSNDRFRRALICLKNKFQIKFYKINKGKLGIKNIFVDELRLNKKIPNEKKKMELKLIRVYFV